MEKDEKIVSVRIIAETNQGNKYYVYEDLGVAFSLDLDGVRDEIEACGFQTDWLE
jgi:hypothetical protein